MIHDFNECLAASHVAADWPGWEGLYRQAFPDFAAMIDHRQDGEHQRAGVDRSIVLLNSKQLLIDEKVRGRNKKTGRVYEDIFLEYVSQRRADREDVPGWVAKPLRADFIAYLIAPIGKAYIFPTIQLQTAWRIHGQGWIEEYGERKALNRGYVTLGVGVPPNVVFSAVGQALRLMFPPFECDGDVRGAA